LSSFIEATLQKYQITVTGVATQHSLSHCHWQSACSLNRAIAHVRI